jgi:transposase InsO family protein
MTALPAHPQASSLTPQASPAWVPLDEAARLMGKSEGHMRRLCQRLADRGLARKAGSAWSLSVAASPRLLRRSVEAVLLVGGASDGLEGSAVTESLKAASSAKLADAKARASAVIEFRRWRSRDGVQLSRDLPGFLAAASQRHGLALSRSRLYAWDQACPTSDDFAGCVAALLDTRGRPRAGSTTISDAAWSMFCEVYLAPNQRSIKHCHEIVASRAVDQGWGWPSVSRVKQLVRERLDPSTITLRREGAEAWARTHAAPMGQDPDAWAAGQCWEGDHTPFDFSVRVRRGGEWRPARAQLTAWLDRRTRRLMGWHISEQGNQGTIRLALLDALGRDGVSVPEIVWLDNGKDFCAASIGGLTKSERRGMTRDEKTEAEARATGLLRMLAIEPHFALPYNHDGKARIERFFGTLHQRFDREFHTWCGSRPGMVERKELNAKLRDVLSLPTLEELAERLSAWIEWYNHRAEHEIDDLADRETGELLSPIEFYTRYLPARRTIDRSLLPLLGLVWSRPLAVHKHGVSIEIAGRVVRYGEMQPALEPLVGSAARVFVSYDPADTARVEIWDSQFRHLCTAPENGRYGGLADDRVTSADRKAAHAARREQKRRALARVDLTSLSLSDVELASKAARDREIDETRARLQERGHDDPPPIRLVSTPLDGAPQREAMRQAVGAEHWPDSHDPHNDQDTNDDLDFTRLTLRRDETDDPHDDDDDGLDLDFDDPADDQTDDQTDDTDNHADDDLDFEGMLNAPCWGGEDQDADGDLLLEIS